MKKLIFVFCLMISLLSWADDVVVEFDETQEMACHQKMRTLGCVTSSGEEDLSCAEKNKAKLGKSCLAMTTERSKHK